MIYFGYTMNYGYGIPQSADAIRATCCTQQYVWEYIHNHIDISCNVPGRESWNVNYMSTVLLADWTARTEDYYNMYHGNTSFNGTTAKVTLGESTKVTDSNGKLAAYAGFTHNVNGITFHHEQGSNDLIITASNDCTADSVSFKTRDYGLFQLMPNGIPYNSSTMSNYVYIKFTSGSVQNLIFSNYVDPSEFNINVQIEYGNKDTEYTVYAKEDIYNVAKTVKYFSANEEIATYKFDSNGIATINITTKSNNENLTTDKNVLKGLPMGNYYAKETKVPLGYLPDNETHSYSIKYKDMNTPIIKVEGTLLVEMKDMPILNDITLIKIDADTKAKILDKFTFGLYADKECTQLIQQVDSNKDEGTITFKDLRYGTYYIKEITAPKGYRKSDKVVKVEINDKGIFVDGKQIEKDNNEIYSFEFEDQIIETPKTGDNSNIKFWFIALGISFVLLVGVIIFEIKKFKN